MRCGGCGAAFRSNRRRSRTMKLIPMPSPSGRNDSNLFISADFLRPGSGARGHAFDSAGGLLDRQDSGVFNDEEVEGGGLRPPVRTVEGEGVVRWPAIEKWLRERLDPDVAEDAMQILRASGADLPKPAVETSLPAARFAEPLDGAVTVIKRSEAPTGRQGMDAALDALLEPRRSRSAIQREAERIAGPWFARIEIG